MALEKDIEQQTQPERLEAKIGDRWDLAITFGFGAVGGISGRVIWWGI